MAATFTPVTLEEIEAFLKRAFRTMRPKLVNFRGEQGYQLKVSDFVYIMVLTSVGHGSSSGAEKGEDAIRVGLRSYKTDKWLDPSARLPHVKRILGWRDNLRERIETAYEEYFEKYAERDPSANK